MAPGIHYDLYRAPLVDRSTQELVPGSPVVVSHILVGRNALRVAKPYVLTSLP